MDLEKELVRIALVGTQRSPLSDECKTGLDNLGLPEAENSEDWILKGAAILSQMNRADFKPIQLSVNDKVEATLLDEKVCSPTSIKHLYMIVDGAFENALPEFLFNLAKHKKCLPPETLPHLLDLSLTSSELWGQLKKSIGKRGGWLIHQNPDWERLTERTVNTPWDEASNDERLFIFEKTRKKNPTKALEMLRETWSSESVNQKVRFLKVLDKSLKKDAEPFLEELLDARRKEVRRTAVQLLAKLPDSSLSNRMFERMKGLMTLKKRNHKKEKLEIKLPEKLGNDMIRDGIDPRVQWFKGGVKASRLGQMVALIPPKMWAEHFKMTPEEVVELFVRSDWGELLIQAMVEATFLHKNKEWTRALLSFRISSSDRQRWQSLNVSRLMDDLPDDVFNAVAIKGMKNTEGLLEENSPITQLLKTSASLWQDELTMLVVKNLQDWLAGESSRYWNGWHYRTILKKAAYTCNPLLHDKLSNNWPEESRIWSSWEREIEEFLSTLFFRKKMIKALSIS